VEGRGGGIGCKGKKGGEGRGGGGGREGIAPPILNVEQDGGENT